MVGHLQYSFAEEGGAVRHQLGAKLLHHCRTVTMQTQLPPSSFHPEGVRCHAEFHWERGWSYTVQIKRSGFTWNECPIERAYDRTRLELVTDVTAVLTAELLDGGRYEEF